ncbi:hypothetical protein K1T71_004374 [Dendrolimus kikuchii]|uniref:Uncharacterized protein n=1 Tax=Dendrolimus kikuchii TaxID=765133 RepID=A0ACC1D786_9NEOP|nr:hypothetical protein K1T71_004374 [Dendrolimus kikuchii]
MTKAFALLVLLVNLLTLNCQEEESLEEQVNRNNTDEGKTSYSFSYGVSDLDTGDVKTVWEAKEGDTVKGHYSLLQPDGSIKTVEYLAGPNIGFKAVVNSETEEPPEKTGLNSIEDKAMRDYGKYIDYNEEGEEDFYERKRNKRPFDSFKDYSHKKKSKYPFDQEPSEYTHSISIKHPSDGSESEAHSHVGYNFDPNCKTKTKKESQDNLYSNGVDPDLSKTKYPTFSSISYKDHYDSSYNSDFDKYKPVNQYKPPRFDEDNVRPASSVRYTSTYPGFSDISSPEKFYPEELPPRPKKKYRPYKLSEFPPTEDLDDYYLVPKKKFKRPPRIPEQDFRPEREEEYDRPHYSSDSDDFLQEDKYYNSPIRGSGPKEVIRKVVKKRRPPIINLLDVLDI